MGSQGVEGGIWGIPWGYWVGLMSLLMIHKAYLYNCIQGIQIFIADRQTGQPGVVQEVLADLKRKVPKQNMQVCTDDKDK